MQGSLSGNPDYQSRTDCPVSLPPLLSTITQSAPGRGKVSTKDHGTGTGRLQPRMLTLRLTDDGPRGTEPSAFCDHRAVLDKGVT